LLTWRWNKLQQRDTIAVRRTVAFDYFKANAKRVSASIHPTEKGSHLHLVELQASGAPDA